MLLLLNALQNVNMCTNHTWHWVHWSVLDFYEYRYTINYETNTTEFFKVSYYERILGTVNIS